jgi:biopolymer transport protein ExbD
MKFKPRRSEEPEINVVSLIDVVLLLVVFFMLSSNFTAEGRLRSACRRRAPLPVQRPADEGLVVTVSASGSYLVNGASWSIRAPTRCARRSSRPWATARAAAR